MTTVGVRERGKRARAHVYDSVGWKRCNDRSGSGSDTKSGLIFQLFQFFVYPPLGPGAGRRAFVAVAPLHALKIICDVTLTGDLPTSPQPNMETEAEAALRRVLLCFLGSEPVPRFPSNDLDVSYYRTGYKQAQESVAKSALQKAIRRGDSEVANYWAAVLLASHQIENLFGRLLTIASEDIGPADNSILAYVVEAYKLYKAARPKVCSANRLCFDKAKGGQALEGDEELGAHQAAGQEGS